MGGNHNVRPVPFFAALLLVLPLALAGCTSTTQTQAKPDTVRQQSLGSFSYHPVVYHLDLSILAYQLYSQSLVWPFDPYYEESNSPSGGRARIMNNVRAWAKVKGGQQLRQNAKLGGYRGPGHLGGFGNNKSHDPIVYRYDRLRPWDHAIANADGRWTEYLTPRAITGRIGDVYMCYRKAGQAENAVAVDHVVSGRGLADPGARDVLLAFEGGTGDKGLRGQPASQSLMGFVLLRYAGTGKDYDVHIAFRGSRSGSLLRA